MEWIDIMRDGANHDEAIKIIYQFLEDMEQDANLKQRVYEDCKSSKIKKTEYLSFIIDGLGKVEVDKVMSDISENPVGNKYIKSYWHIFIFSFINVS